MRQVLLAATLSLVFSMPALAQGPAQDDTRKLEAELKALRDKISDVESRLRNAMKAAEDDAKKDEKRPDGSRDPKKGGFGKGGFGKGDFGKGDRAGKGPGGGFGKGWPFDGPRSGWGSDPEKMKEFQALVEKARAEMDKKYGKGEEKKKEDEKKREDRKKDAVKEATPTSGNVEDRLDRLLREIEDIRRELKQRK